MYYITYIFSTYNLGCSVYKHLIHTANMLKHAYYTYIYIYIFIS